MQLPKELANLKDGLRRHLHLASNVACERAQVNSYLLLGILNRGRLLAGRNAEKAISGALVLCCDGTERPKVTTTAVADLNAIMSET